MPRCRPRRIPVVEDMQACHVKREQRLAKKPQKVENWKIPIMFLPTHLLLRILQKMEFFAWFRLRRTCHFIENFISKEAKSFAIECNYTDLEIEYNFWKKKLKLTVNEEDYFQQENSRRRKVTKLSSTLSGLHFKTIYIRWNKRRPLSLEDWPRFEKVMKKFANNVVVGCDVLETPFGIEILSLLTQFFRSVDHISCGSICELNFGYSAHCSSTLNALNATQSPSLKDTFGLHFVTDSNCDHLVPLMQRFQQLEISTESPNFVPSVPEEIWRNVQGMLMKVHHGAFKGQKKIVDISYFSKTNDHYSNGCWKPFRELEAIPIRRVWEQKEVYPGVNDDSGYFNHLFFIETQGSFAVCLLHADLHANNWCQIKLSMNLEPKFESTQVISLLNEMVALRVDRSKLLKAIENQDWVAFGIELTKLKHREES